MATEIVRQLVGGVWKTIAGSGGGGGAALTVSDGSTTVTDVTTLDLTGHTVSEVSPGVAEANVSVPVQAVTVELTDAQIKGLPTAGGDVEIVPAPGANKIIVFVMGILACDTSGGFYEWAADAYLEFRVGGATTIGSLVHDEGNLLGSLLGSEELFIVQVPPVATIDTAGIDTIQVTHVNEGENSAGYFNTSLALRASNGGAAFTGGNAANTMKVTVLYMVVDL